eukprot:1157581-Pelagomonas_calceolata.AAC.3
MFHQQPISQILGLYYSPSRPTPCNPCSWICPNTLCAVWPDFAFASAHSKLSKLLGMMTFLLPVTFAVPKMMCRMNSMLNSNVHTGDPRASNQTSWVKASVKTVLTEAFTSCNPLQPFRSPVPLPERFHTCLLLTM